MAQVAQATGIKTGMNETTSKRASLECFKPSAMVSPRAPLALFAALQWNAEKHKEQYTPH